VEFASGTLADIAGLYAAPDAAAFGAKEEALRRRFAQAEAAFIGPWFDGDRFGLVDAAFGPVFRYLDTFEALAGLELMDGLARAADWRASLAERPSVASAVAPDYRGRLTDFLRARNSYLSGIMALRATAAEGALV
jgi:glutathione S-transferase